MDKVHTWGPPIWQTTISDSIIKDLLEQGDAIRNHEQFNAENDLAMNTHDEWNYTPDFRKWFSQAIRGKLVDYMQYGQSMKTTHLTSGCRIGILIVYGSTICSSMTVIHYTIIRGL